MSTDASQPSHREPEPRAKRAAAGDAALRVQVCYSLAEVAPADWDRLLEPDDAPLLSWAYLQGLEPVSYTHLDVYKRQERSFS